MRNITKILLSVLFTIALATSTTALADGFRKSGPPPAWLIKLSESWMGDLDDSTALHKLSIPGTHDSGAIRGGLAAQTQAWTIAEQLAAGIRFLDIRLRPTIHGLAVHHGLVYMGFSFEDTLQSAKKFLDNQPTEAVFIFVANSGHPDEPGAKDYTTQLREHYCRHLSVLYTDDDEANLTLGAARGKIIIVTTDDRAVRCDLPEPSPGAQQASRSRRVPPSRLRPNARAAEDQAVTQSSKWVIGIPYGPGIGDECNDDGVETRRRIQNYWKVSWLAHEATTGCSSATLPSKFKLVRQYVDHAHRGFDGFILNFLSGATHMAPVDVARAVNRDAFYYIEERHGKHAERLGIFMMDFPGEQLVARIISRNREQAHCKPKSFYSRSDATWVRFNLPKGGKYEEIRVPGGANNKYVFPKCNRVFWTDMVFQCSSQGEWRMQSGRTDADAWCHGTVPRNPYIESGSL
jgi:hypothetical protein